jgi:hypothetical protein
VVWAGRGKLWLERPAVLIWQLDDLTYLLEDIEKGKPLPEQTVSKIAALLKAAQSARADRSDAGPGGLLADDEGPG